MIGILGHSYFVATGRPTLLGTTQSEPRARQRQLHALRNLSDDALNGMGLTRAQVEFEIFGPRWRPSRNGHH